MLNRRVHVDFHFRQLAFRGVGGQPPRLRLRGLNRPTFPARVELPSDTINNGLYNILVYRQQFLRVYMKVKNMNAIITLNNILLIMHAPHYI